MIIINLGGNVNSLGLNRMLLQEDIKSAQKQYLSARHGRWKSTWRFEPVGRPLRKSQRKPNSHGVMQGQERTFPGREPQSSIQTQIFLSFLLKYKILPLLSCPPLPKKSAYSPTKFSLSTDIIPPFTNHT